MVLITILGLSIGYSAFNTELSISGDATVKKQSLGAYLVTKVYESDGVNGLYYHDGNGTYANAGEETGDYSYRYSGADPNNYICFGSNLDPCPEDNLYRIIGIFNNYVKLIKNDYPTINQIGTGSAYYNNYLDAQYNVDDYRGSQNLVNVGSYYYNDSGINTWSDSSLNTVNFNINFLSSLDSSWQDMIAVNTWYIDGYTTSSATTKTWYTHESSGSTIHSKIGLMYVSDYGYASTPEFWLTEVNSYSSASNNNWLYLGLYEWTISHAPNSTSSAFRISSLGNVAGNDINIALAVRPCFYLNQDVEYVSGDGTKDNPYQIVD